MPGIILTGSEHLRQEFIDDFIKTHSILPYNIQRFDVPLKIEHVRSIIKYVSYKATHHQPRLIIISNTVTIEAQNALLKTIEELSEDIFLIVSSQSKDIFLPTILSRCVIKNFPSDVLTTSNPNSLLSSLMQKYIDLAQTQPSVIFQIGEYCDTKEEHIYRDIVFEVRKKLLQAVSTASQKEKIPTLIKLLRQLNAYVPLVEKNNFNTRMVVESILLRGSDGQL